MIYYRDYSCNPLITQEIYCIGYALDAKSVSAAIMAAANSPRMEIIVPFFYQSGSVVQAYYALYY